MKVQEKTVSINGEYYIDFEEIKEKPSNFKHLVLIFCLLFSGSLGTKFVPNLYELPVAKTERVKSKEKCHKGRLQDRLKVLKYGNIPHHLKVYAINDIMDELLECLK